jgi:hypothetical protein
VKNKRFADHILAATPKYRRPQWIEHFFDTVDYLSGDARVHMAKQ